MSAGAILVVEDDTALRHSLTETLRALNFEVRDCARGELALVEMRQQPFDVILLDLNMLGMGGISACLKLRELHPRVAIIVLTVRDRDEDKVAALDAGADDYVTKPFQLTELTARIRAAIRRGRQPETSSTQRIILGGIMLDPVAYRVTVDDEECHLTPKEFELLHLLMRHAGCPITHHRLLTQIWGDEYGGEREYLRTYIRQLRRKVEKDPANPRYLRTESYVGYRFEPS
jgi:two-component system KDP operon response regulator KdpE